MTIVPDDKDWTWVLQRPCPECGLDTRGIAREDVAGMLRANAQAWPAVLAGADARHRPAPATWSALEYGCHVRDVFRRFDDLPSVLAETLALEQRPKTLWLQEGLWHEEVGRDADAAGMQVVMDRCLMVEHARLG